MSNTFQVSILSRDEIHSLPGIWSASDLRQLLHLGDADDIGDVAEDDLQEICLMWLQDQGIQRAGELVLEAVFADTMRPGVRQNLVDDLQDDQPWNDFPQVSQQRGIFAAVCLLHKAFPTRYGTPDATRLKIVIKAQSDAGLAALDAMRPAWLVRLLACGMSERNIMHRLYRNELRQGEFPEASGLIWGATPCDPETEQDHPNRTIAVTASSQLFHSLEEGQRFVAVV